MILEEHVPNCYLMPDAYSPVRGHIFSATSSNRCAFSRIFNIGRDLQVQPLPFLFEHIMSDLRRCYLLNLIFWHFDAKAAIFKA